LADEATRRRIRLLGLNPESVGDSPHLSGARFVGQFLQDDFDFDLDIAITQCTANIGGHVLLSTHLDSSIYAAGGQGHIKH
jgi:hypothetical protein